MVTASIAATSNSGHTAICGYLSILDDAGISNCGRYGFFSNRDESEIIDLRQIAAAPDSRYALAFVFPRTNSRNAQAAFGFLASEGIPIFHPAR